MVVAAWLSSARPGWRRHAIGRVFGRDQILTYGGNMRAPISLDMVLSITKLVIP